MPNIARHINTPMIVPETKKMKNSMNANIDMKEKSIVAA